MLARSELPKYPPVTPCRRCPLPALWLVPCAKYHGEGRRQTLGSWPWQPYETGPGNELTFPLACLRLQLQRYRYCANGECSEGNFPKHPGPCSVPKKRTGLHPVARFRVNAKFCTRTIFCRFMRGGARAGLLLGPCRFSGAVQKQLKKQSAPALFAWSQSPAHGDE